ncbi:MAG TPA: DUF6152 family protein [Methylophilus sp.]
MKQLKRLRSMAGLSALLATGLLFNTHQVTAHHAFSAEFDALKPIELKGVVTKAEWVNPHSWVYIDVKEADGSVSNWGFEFGAPFSLKQKGLTKAVIPAGTEVTISGYLSKNGKKFGYSTALKLADGRVFQTGGAQDAPGTPAAN